VFTVIFAGHVIVGGWLSFTVMVNVQLAPEAVVDVTVVVPLEKNEPDAGTLVTGPHKPVVVGAGKFTIAPHWPGVTLVVMFAGHTIVHGAPQHAGCDIEILSILQPVLPPLTSDPIRNFNFTLCPAADVGRVAVVVVTAPLFTQPFRVPSGFPELTIRTL